MWSPPTSTPGAIGGTVTDALYTEATAAVTAPRGLKVTGMDMMLAGLSYRAVPGMSDDDLEAKILAAHSKRAEGGRRKGINNRIKLGLAAYLKEVTGLLGAVEPREASVRYALEVLTAICNSLPPDTDTPAMRVTLGDARHVWDVLTKKLTDREVLDIPEVPEVPEVLAKATRTGSV